jgi:hypothetical protein
MPEPDNAVMATEGPTSEHALRASRTYGAAADQGQPAHRPDTDGRTGHQQGPDRPKAFHDPPIRKVPPHYPGRPAICT